MGSRFESLLIGEAENSLFMTGGETVDGYCGLVFEGYSEVVFDVYSGVCSDGYMADAGDVYCCSCCGGVGGVAM